MNNIKRYVKSSRKNSEWFASNSRKSEDKFYKKIKEATNEVPQNKKSAIENDSKKRFKRS